jgi:hypothetical protein
MRLESLENRQLMTTSVFFEETSYQIVNDHVGSVQVHVGLTNGPSDTQPVTVNLSTGGGTAVPGVDYTPVEKTFTLNPVQNPSPTTTGPVEEVTIPILPGPASLGTRVLQVSIAPNPGAPQGASEYIVITHGTDTTPPYIVNSQALTQGGKVVAFSLQFSKPMAIGPVINPANYQVVAPKSSLEVAMLMMSDAPSLVYSNNIAIKSTTYDANTNTLYLVPVNPLKPNSVGKKFHAAFEVGSPNDAGFSNLTDTSGNPISSDDPQTMFASLGSFVQMTGVTKAGPSVLSYLSLTPTHSASRGKPKPAHKAR